MLTQFNVVNSITVIPFINVQQKVSKSSPIFEIILVRSLNFGTQVVDGKDLAAVLECEHKRTLQLLFRIGQRAIRSVLMQS